MAAGSTGRPVRVRLCAIAKDEGPYLVDWVFHHLRAGFDGIEVWVNGTRDTSVDILTALADAEAAVTFRVVDDLLQRSLRRGRSFQHVAYRKQAAQAARQGFTHAAFLDLDEYWTPADLTSSIHDFLPADPAVAVVSFPWCVDVPDPRQEPFTHPLETGRRLQLDPHVKSVVRLDDRLDRVLTHTARITQGRRLLVREDFPIADERAQQWGSTTPGGHWTSRRQVPEAFVLHALHRSQQEYVAALGQGMRQTGAETEFKTNRSGYVASAAAVLEYDPGPTALTAYLRERDAFRARVGVEAWVDSAQAASLRTAEEVLARARTDEQVLRTLRTALHGVCDAGLDRAWPGWDTGLRFSADTLETAPDGRVEVVGWAFATAPGTDIELALLDPAGAIWDALPRAVVERPDVASTHPAAPTASGFRLEVPAAWRTRAAECTLLVRLRDSAWERVPLDRTRALP